MDFASYWKEVAVVLAALFAIAGTVFEVKDKASHRITIWGRVFFGLTLLSMIGGFYAQWEQSASEARRNKQSQDDMLKVIENTNRNVYDVSRVLQPLGRSQISLLFKPNCIELKEFCDAALKEAKQETTTDSNISSFSLRDVDWSKWPDSRNLAHISMFFFKDKISAKKYLGNHCLGCNTGDIYFETYFNIENAPDGIPGVMVSYDVDNKELLIGTFDKAVSPGVNGDKILSTIDLPGSTLIIYGSNELFKKLTLNSLTITTDRGQTIDIENPTIVNVKGQTLFEYVFPDTAQH